ncbi:MAG: YaiI/YqxD family protein [Gammaproteobacteria bacterium]|nr:YaiI/YqxD family protein [Gammaproteobacteria bacterium]NVK89355.1 YaiI/YqxD family protein [Gammaproteobacteria bacterium]
MTKIWVDADACPKVIKAILYRAAERCQIEVILVANQSLTVPSSRFIKTLRVLKEVDAADQEIVQRLLANDLVITDDIPMAAEAIAKGAIVLRPRGEWLTQANIGEKLSLRDFFDVMRGAGVESGGPAAFSGQDQAAFANALDGWLQKQTRT